MLPIQEVAVVELDLPGEVVEVEGRLPSWEGVVAVVAGVLPWPGEAAAPGA
jgi:hypothetical protein